jgi:hypothetical protein
MRIPKFESGKLICSDVTNVDAKIALRGMRCRGTCGPEEKLQ